MLLGFFNYLILFFIFFNNYANSTFWSGLNFITGTHKRKNIMLKEKTTNVCRKSMS